MIEPSMALLKKAAAAAKQTPEQFARRVRKILCAPRCRDTSRRQRVFTPEVMRAIFCA